MSGQSYFLAGTKSYVRLKYPVAHYSRGNASEGRGIR
ncbi:hypothetical protein FOPG_10936 [Fusarium oxysporum f. sp. conglutinans race 2 54008]|uniref:Uncharacterized protein n=3 Tax=Fusarium oxysporum TaxID=5507 RepID=X0LFT1_FUSOX|nr:hypothetical protein FOVG_08172 [Fusarium oxysporum f. sp. pisi HDV247]EXL73876.1 hypothetical protein FOPG_10936 [Fusarium oxysporum f. sp. conglutinans race 2 54008]EXM19881.1 hypothetical protein FOTG_12114 [Fusarium oxysporum f. sp. vasinfectum 25433]KAI8413114.1 hypothetical protein FOFC_06389 [Fusarium oxysporum]